MTVFSREQELPNIFERILNSHDWKGLEFYKYYLEHHIQIDSQEGGHSDLTSHFELDEGVLEKFYKARYEFYTCSLTNLS